MTIMICYDNSMDNNTQTPDSFENDLVAFALKHSLERIKTESPNFIREYRRGRGGDLYLVTEKAVIKALGKVSKVKIGEGEKYQTYAEAEKAVREYWSNYFKERRNRRTDAEKAGEQRRQKRYREKKKGIKTTLKRQQ